MWLDGSFAENGALRLRVGETSRGREAGLKGVWRESDGARTLELLLPYAALGLTDWPASGDLGMSFLWTHQGTAGVTRLQWSEDRHPWNPRWFGVVRLQEKPDAAALPWMLRSRP